ncbi:hypothetical protein D3C81_1406940 [compost metagenome]
MARCRRRSSRRIVGYRLAAQLVALPTNGTQISGLTAIVVQRLTQQPHALGNGFLVDLCGRPDVGDQLIKADNPRALRQQVMQQTEAEPGDIQHLAAFANHALPRHIDTQVIKAIVQGCADGRFRHEPRPTECTRKLLPRIA